MYLRYLFILLFSLFFSFSVNASNNARIDDIKIVKSDGSSYDYEIIGGDNKISIKYLLPENILFEISGNNFIGNDYKGSLLIEIDDIVYENQIYYTMNTKSKIYFGTSWIRDLLLDSISKSFRFKFCPYGDGECTQSKSIFLKKEKQTYNDSYYNFQYYMKDMNIEKAKEIVENKYIPTIAIIDDGISILHNDLEGKYWINTNEINGNGIDDDNNGYIDDYYGWNFVDDNNIMYPKGDHGTTIAGIIGANTNNNIGIVGIVNDVKLMPIITCSSSGCIDESISKSINYAVDNGANIINLSLGGQWFAYDENISEAIKYAVDNGVIIVTSAGNGDKFLTGKGVDTSIHKISPVCNENDYTDIIGVSALSLFSDKSKNGIRTYWSNYGECTDISAYGERIASISKDGGYTIKNDGTSFSAPIIAGVIGLGYNQYGKIDNSIVYKTLLSSTNKWHGINAKTYIEKLGENIELLEKKDEQVLENNQNQYTNNENLKNKYKIIYKKKLGTKLEKFPIKTLKDLLNKIDIYLGDYSENEDLVGRLEALKEIIQETLSY